MTAPEVPQNNEPSPKCGEETNKLAGKRKLLKTIAAFLTLLLLPLVWPAEQLDTAAYAVMVIATIGISSQGAVDWLKVKTTTQLAQAKSPQES